MRLRSIEPTETDECIAFVEWTKLIRYCGEPLFERLVKIPNERGKAGPMTAILTRIGLKRGFPDYALLVPLPPYCGLFIEAKRIGGRADAEQEAWRRRLIRFGYHAEISAGADAMIGAVTDYLRLAHPDDCSLGRGDVRAPPPPAHVRGAEDCQ